MLCKFVVYIKMCISVNFVIYFNVEFNFIEIKFYFGFVLFGIYR